MSLHKSNSQNQSRQLMRPMWRVETMVLPVQIGSRKTCLQKEETYRALSTRNSQFQKGLIVTHLTELNVKHALMALYKTKTVIATTILSYKSHTCQYKNIKRLHYINVSTVRSRAGLSLLATPHTETVLAKWSAKARPINQCIFPLYR